MTNNPLQDLVRDLEPLLLRHAAAAEANRKMAPEVMAALVDTGLLRMWGPKAYGGAETEPNAAPRREGEGAEGGARGDGGTRARRPGDGMGSEQLRLHLDAVPVPTGSSARRAARLPSFRHQRGLPPAWGRPGQRCR